MAPGASLRAHTGGMAVVGCGGPGGEEEGQCEMVAGAAGMPRPHSVVSAIGRVHRRPLCASGGGKIPLNNKIVKYCFDLSFFIIF